MTSTESCDNCHHISDSPEACGFCHNAPAGDTLTFASRTFLHDPHLDMGFGCDACHEAPSMAVQEENCATCHSLHHVPTTNCLLCHDEAPQETLPTAGGSFPHQPHADMGLTCATCHTEAGAGASMDVCATCHSLHHQTSTDCRMCHTEDPKGNHRADMAHVTACTVCHSGADQASLTKWSPMVCLVCHQDKEEHSGGMECTLCHEIPPLPGGGGGGGKPKVPGGVSPFLHLNGLGGREI